jgi:hypothetical protein
LSDYSWRKSSCSGYNNDCVEIRNDHGAIRDTKNTDRPIGISRGAMRALVAALTAGTLALGGIMLVAVAPAQSSSIAGQCRC